MKRPAKAEEDMKKVKKVAKKPSKAEEMKKDKKVVKKPAMDMKKDKEVAFQVPDVMYPKPVQMTKRQQAFFDKTGHVMDDHLLAHMSSDTFMQVVSSS